MTDVPPTTENPKPPTVIDGTTGNVLPPGNDIRSEQIKTVAQAIAPNLTDDQKLRVQREALQQGIEERKATSVAAGQVDSTWKYEPTKSQQTVQVQTKS